MLVASVTVAVVAIAIAIAVAVAVASGFCYRGPGLQGFGV